MQVVPSHTQAKHPHTYPDLKINKDEEDLTQKWGKYLWAFQVWRLLLASKGTCICMHRRKHKILKSLKRVNSVGPVSHLRKEDSPKNQANETGEIFTPLTR